MTILRIAAPLMAAPLLATAQPALSQPAPSQSSPAMTAPTSKSAPTAVPIAQTVPDAQDIPYPGVIRLEIDASDITRALYRVKQTVPVVPGSTSLILQLPSWLPGNHAPRGPINLIADVRFEVGGKPIAWTRDPVEVNAFHLALPAGTREVVAHFIHTSPLQTNEGRITMTQEMLNLQWEKMSLYPAGHYVRQITFAPSVTFPKDWTAFAALDGESRNGDTVRWAPVDYETLVDSPVFAGKYARAWDLGHDVSLDVVADAPELLELAPENLDAFRRLVSESLTLFGARHFDRYELLLALTDRMGGIGLEHQRSSENSYEPKAFVDWANLAHDRNVTSHELVHSWNGKFRRPARLWAPDYRQPTQGNLLWMYEGQTQFWGWILAARSGLQPKETVLGAIANSAGLYATQPGRGWRSVEDTTHDPIINARRPVPYPTLSRSEDYYNEGMMLWLEADQIIRAGTDGARGLDDFARAFFGTHDGDWGQITYELDDIVATLNGVYPHDWAKFLTEKFQTPNQPAPLAGVERGGYRLVWKAEPNPYEAGRMKSGKNLNLLYSLGMTINSSGEITTVMWDGPAFNAGLVDGVSIIAVNGTAYSDTVMKQAITAATVAKEPVELMVKRGDRYLTVPIAYHDGLRYPWIEPVAEGEQPLDRLLAPRVTTGE